MTSETASLHAPEARAPHPASPLANRWWALGLISLATLMSTMDAAIVIVALPSAQRALGISDATRQWVLTAYTLAYGGLLLQGGRLADRLGHRRTLLIGALGFAAASALSGAAVSGPMLIAGRALQGSFAALLVPSTRALLVLLFRDPKERALAVGLFSAVFIGGLGVGFILSGIITNYLDWRWTLYINTPVALVVAIGVLRTLPGFPGDPGVRIDLPGVVLSSGGVAALVYGLSQAATHGPGSLAVLGPLTAAAALLGAFVLVEARVRRPLLPLRILTERNRAGSFVALGLNSFGNFGMLLILTYELQTVLRASPLVTGLALVPWAIANAFSSAVLSPRLMPRVPARYLLAAGLLLAAAGLVLLTRLTPASGYAPLILSAQLLIGFGAGLNGTPALAAALSGVAPRDTGVTSAMSSASNQIGASIGTAVLSTVAVLASGSYLAAHGGSAGAVAAVAGFASAMGWGAAVLVAGALLVALLVDADPRRGPAAAPGGVEAVPGDP
jgi:EmrB/QacA subfamily drug resistance transporter